VSGSPNTPRTSTAQARLVYVLRLRAKPDIDPIRALRWLLKIAWRRFGLRCVSAVEERERGEP
jgi:hypothetical protein